MEMINEVREMAGLKKIEKKNLLSDRAKKYVNKKLTKKWKPIFYGLLKKIGFSLPNNFFILDGFDSVLVTQDGELVIGSSFVKQSNNETVIKVILVQIVAFFASKTYKGTAADIIGWTGFASAIAGNVMNVDNNFENDEIGDYLWIGGSIAILASVIGDKIMSVLTEKKNNKIFKVMVEKAIGLEKAIEALRKEGFNDIVKILER
jgi:membrane-bound ClpP family serine protease